MKELLSLQGGYPRNIDYLLHLQGENLTAMNGLLSSLGIDLALSGCAVTDHQNGMVSIAHGLVLIGGEVLRFDGVANLADYGNKTLIKGAYVTTEPTIFADESTKNIYREAKAIVSSKTSMLQIEIKNTNLYNLQNYIQDTVAGYALKGEFKDVYDFDGSFAQNFDASGLGITARWQGWALANGNNGTPNLQGRVRVTMGRSIDTDGVQYTYSNGSIGGEVRHQLNIAEMPRHSHPFTGSGGASGGGDTKRKSVPNRMNTEEVGGNQAHNNMQPYFVCYTVIKIA